MPKGNLGKKRCPNTLATSELTWSCAHHPRRPAAPTPPLSHTCEFLRPPTPTWPEYGGCCGCGRHGGLEAPETDVTKFTGKGHMPKA